jgi:ACR3 family arsenite efflux pump ArsB
MQLDLVALRRSSLFAHLGASTMLVFCELEVVHSLRSAADVINSYTLLFVLALPVVIGWITRSRLAKWEASGQMSSIATAQVDSVTSVLVLIAYLVFLLAKHLR